MIGAIFYIGLVQGNEDNVKGGKSQIALPQKPAKRSSAMVTWVRLPVSLDDPTLEMRVSRQFMKIGLIEPLKDGLESGKLFVYIVVLSQLKSYLRYEDCIYKNKTFKASESLSDRNRQTSFILPTQTQTA